MGFEILDNDGNELTVEALVAEYRAQRKHGFPHPVAVENTAKDLRCTAETVRDALSASILRS